MVAMPDYQFSTVKVVPQSSHREPVAVGVILYDPKRGEVHRRFTDNWDEVRRRTGLSSLPDMRSVAEEGPVKVADGYLAAMSEDQFPDTLLVTRPNNLMPFDTPRDALDWIFGTHVGLPARPVGGDAHGRRADALLGAQIRDMGFARGSYKCRYEFRVRPPAVKFPHVFLRNGVPLAALFAVSVRSASATDTIKSRIGDIASIEKWHMKEVSFMMWAAEARDGAELAGAVAHGIAERLEKWGVEVVYQDGIGDALAQIRDRVSPAPASLPR